MIEKLKEYHNMASKTAYAIYGNTPEGKLFDAEAFASVAVQLEILEELKKMNEKLDGLKVPAKTTRARGKTSTK